MPFKPLSSFCVSGCRATKHRGRCKCPIQITVHPFPTDGFPASVPDFDSTSAFTPLLQFVCKYQHAELHCVCFSVVQFSHTITISLILSVLSVLISSVVDRQTDAARIKVVERQLSWTVNSWCAHMDTYDVTGYWAVSLHSRPLLRCPASVFSGLCQGPLWCVSNGPVPTEAGLVWSKHRRKT